MTNPSAAVPGQPVELDAQLRQRQTISTALPSLTVFEGTLGAVASITGVERLKGYENDSGAPDTNGIPAHSISLVVQGGDATAIAQA
ncbi:phage baseplate protein, partial [Acinetobacter baumannii]|nr:phage baseplate protein [Acinetobacter baumannii]